MSPFTRIVCDLSLARGAAMVCAMLVSAAASAGGAVQWPVSAGGNGHWYWLAHGFEQRPTSGRQFASGQGGHLATFSSAAEWQYVSSSFDGQHSYTIGLFQAPENNPIPGDGWYWVTGEPFGAGHFAAWCGGEPNDWAGNAQWVVQTSGPCWDDTTDVAPQTPIVEFDADCNNDGIVDYGQCRDGSLPDYNGNNIPDCCEQGTPCVVGDYPVHWRVEDGGNGHWYRLANLAAPSAWVQARQHALMMGADLVSIPSAEVQAFVVPLLGAAIVPNGAGGVWIGAYQLSGDPEPGGFRWVSGDVFGYTGPGWSPSNCCSSCPGEVGENYVTISSPADSAAYGFGIGRWNDVGCVGAQSALLEWSADCNNDGLVDYGQILLGQLADTNANGVPDACEAIRVPQDYPTIQAAIDSVSAGTHKLISVAAGTYHESFALNGKDVIVRGAANNATILDGTGLTTSIARFTGGEPATAGLENLVFRNAPSGSRIDPSSPFTVGGAVYGITAFARVAGCRFENCRADYGGGLYLLYCDFAFDGCVFTGNSANDEGGGVLVYESTGTASNCTFTANTCGVSGPGSGSGFKAVGAHEAGESVTLSGCTLTGNTAGLSGAAVEYYENQKSHPGVLRLVGTAVTGNRSGTVSPNGAAGLRVIGRNTSCALSGGTSICSNTPRDVGGPFLIEGTASVCGCVADFTGDGVVDGSDLGILLNSWGLAPASGAGDANHDGLVTGADLGLLLGSWGACH